MACAYECDHCEHVQVVAVIANGLGGYADPHAACERCGRRGSFHSAPGTRARHRRLVDELGPVLEQMQVYKDGSPDERSGH